MPTGSRFGQPLAVQSKKLAPPPTFFCWDDRNPSGYVQVLEEWTSTGTPALSRVYNYGLALISQKQMPSGTVSYYDSDGHGSTRFLLNPTGGMTDTYTYDACGLLIASTGSTPSWCSHTTWVRQCVLAARWKLPG